MENKKIVWEKWIDPFIIEDKEEEPEPYRDSYEKAERGQQKQNLGPVLVGPMGIIPVTENNTPSKIYNFWMGHTNFNISEDVADVINKAPGVETFDIFSRYRFRIAIGKAFTSDEDPFGRSVLLHIQEKLCPKQERMVIVKDPKHTPLSLLKTHLCSKYEHWAIFVLPDGTLDPKGAASKEELLAEVELRNGKTVATSWE